MNRYGPATQSVFTIVAPVRPGALPDLEKVLVDIRKDPKHNTHLPLSREALPVLHFASFVIFGEEDPEPILVFENCVDGSRDDYLHTLARGAGIDNIFTHCAGYPDARDEQSRFKYLRCKSKSPQLYHIGAPYRTAASIVSDCAKRESLDGMLGDEAGTLLKRQVACLPAGTRQYWGREISAPWLALLIAVLAIWLESVIVPRLMALDWLRHPWWAAFWSFDALSVLGAGLLAWSALWVNAVPILRKRAAPWAAPILLLASAGAALRIWPAFPQLLWATRPVQVLVVPILLAIGIAYGVRAAENAQRSERIAALRLSAPGESAWLLWRRLQRENGEYPRERRPGLLGRLWNFRWWLVPLAIVSVPVWLLRRPFATWLFAGLMVTFVLKAAWLAALTGWPASRTVARRTRGLAFVLFGTMIGAFLVTNLFELGTPRVLFAVLTLAGLLLLWVFSVPSADQPDQVDTVDTPAEWKRLGTVTAQEDIEVQNHMSLDAEVPARWRRAVLWFFLVALNHLFYRSVLADLWRGKLFGLTTVHCAQWVMLDGGRFVFLSNYDHTWGSYLDDFGAHLGAGIQKIWGQCAGNPGTGLLEKFKGFVRTRMVPYRVWYRAYPDATLRQIWNTENLRTELTRDLAEEDIVRSIRRLGSAPKSLPEILHADQ